MEVVCRRRLLAAWANSHLDARGLHMQLPWDDGDMDDVVTEVGLSSLLLHLLELVDEDLCSRVSGHVLHPQSPAHIQKNIELLNGYLVQDVTVASLSNGVYSVLEELAVTYSRVNGRTRRSLNQLAADVLQCMQQTLQRAREIPAPALLSVQDMRWCIVPSFLWRFVLTHCDDQQLELEQPEDNATTLKKALQLARERLGVAPLLEPSWLVALGNVPVDLSTAVIFFAQFYQYDVLPCYDDSEVFTREFSECVSTLFARLERVRLSLFPQSESNETACNGTHEDSLLGLAEAQHGLLVMSESYLKLMRRRDEADESKESWQDVTQSLQHLCGSSVDPLSARSALICFREGVGSVFQSLVIGGEVIGAKEDWNQLRAVLDRLTGTTEGQVEEREEDGETEEKDEQEEKDEEEESSWADGDSPSNRKQLLLMQEEMNKLKKELKRSRAEVRELQKTVEEQEQEMRIALMDQDANTLHLRNAHMHKQNERMEEQIRKAKIFKESLINLVDSLMADDRKAERRSQFVLKKQDSSEWKKSLEEMQKKDSAQRALIRMQKRASSEPPKPKVTVSAKEKETEQRAEDQPSRASVATAPDPKQQARWRPFYPTKRS